MEDSAYQREKKISVRQVMFACWLQNMTSVAKTPDRHKYWWEGNYLQLKCDWGTQKTSKLVLPWALWYENPQYPEGDSKTRKNKSQEEEIPKELYQFPQIISICIALSYANVIKCANGETSDLQKRYWSWNSKGKIQDCDPERETEAVYGEPLAEMQRSEAPFCAMNQSQVR